MRKRVMIATNLYQVDPTVYASHMNMMYRVGRNLPDVDIFFTAPWRMSIDNGRQLAVRSALQAECDYLFFYDDDMFLHPYIVERMLKRFEENEEISILMAKAFIRGYPYEPMIFKYVEKGALQIYSDYEKDVRKDGLVKVDAVGCCSTMIDVNLIKLIPEPWFVTGKGHTEDVYFCVKAAEYAENVGIFMDTTIESGHLLDRPILTEYSRKILVELTEEHNLNQIWMPDESFVADIKYQKDPTAQAEYKNPIEKWDEIKDFGGQRDGNPYNNSETVGPD